MELVLLSGGSGKRLWPLSNDSRSKQFLKILEDENGNYLSMVQRVYKQLESVHLENSVNFATSKSQVEIIQNQIGENVPIVIEPERRDTFPAIALSASFLFSEKGISPNEVISVLPVDPYVEDDFFEQVIKLEDIVKNSNSDIALIGVKPTYPSSKFGYIIPNDGKNKEQYSQVSHFKEKPTEKIAKLLIKQGALWNCGVFAFKLDYIINIIKDLGLPVNYTELLSYYSMLPKNSFDYEVVEKANNIVVLPYNGCWKDLGTWNTLTEEMGSDIIGKGKISDDCKNTHLVNELDIPVAILGASNLLVAASPDGILVTEKSVSPRLKEMIDEFNHTPMYVERRWGVYTILDHTKFEKGNEVITKKLKIKANNNLSYQVHEKRTEIWTILNGIGEVVLNGKLKSVKAGDVIEVPVGTKHAIKAISDLDIIEVQKGPEIVKEDVLRFENNWDKVINSYVFSSVNN